MSRRNNPFLILEERTGIPFDELPKNFEIIGKSMLIKFRDNFKYDKYKLAHELKNVFKLHGVYEIRDIEGPMRTLRVDVLCGEPLLERHRENGIIYSLNPSHIMFSKGNKFERGRIEKIVDRTKIVVDMFAGIGYYSLIAARNSKTVHAIEINPEAFYFLLLNKYYNKFDNIIPYLMDCRYFPYDNIADLLILGHFESISYLDKALDIAKNGSVLLVHLLERRGDDNTEQLLEYNMKVVHKRTVKSYSPSMNHVVYECLAMK